MGITWSKWVVCWWHKRHIPISVINKAGQAEYRCIHWLYCELDTLNDELTRSNLPLDVVLDRMKEITEGKFDRLMWEISTMMQDDTYSSEVKEQCIDLPGYKRFVNALGQLKENIRRRYQRDAERAEQAIEEKLARPRF